MEVSAKIRELRAQHSWSQEHVAEKLGVSRQAVTKWETGAGMPDIENIAALARLYGVSTDEIILGFDPHGEGVEGENGRDSAAERYSSVTAFDIAQERHYDIKVGCARSVRLDVVDDEKAAVRLESDSIADLQRAFKVKIDTQGRSLDIDVENSGVVADVLARKELDVAIELPEAFVADVEIALHADECAVEGGHFDLEIGGKLDRLWLKGVEGHVEVDVSNDMEIWADNVVGKLDVNQIGAVSTLHVARDVPYAATTRGRLGRRKLRFTSDGEVVEAPSVEEALLAIELAGASVELTVDAVDDPAQSACGCFLERCSAL